ncbi:hypothetical protein IE994_23320 [Enterobacter hormaechei]|nr:hypothetical protein [Enterobacter hormaechei]
MRREARLRQRIGAGQCFPYQLNDDAGALTLRLTSAAPASDALALRCDGGPLWIGEAESVLALLSDCPALPYAEAALTPPVLAAVQPGRSARRSPRCSASWRLTMSPRPPHPLRCG